LTVEVWYPARLAENQQAGTQYTTITRNLEVMATLSGRAVRDAVPLSGNEPTPLVIISHGYPGNRYLMSHLGENLASKGYVVASIDHRDSTYDNQQAFSSTLYNRPLDQLFVLDQVEAMSASDTGFLSGLVDTERTGVVGYSMGGYGLVINLGGGYSEAFVGNEVAPPNGLAQLHAAANPEFLNNRDPRIKAGFAVAPWGMASGVWNPDDLTGIEVPTFYLAGSVDYVAGYEDGVRAIFENAKRSDRYLLTYINAGHNAGAPIPLPVEIQNNDDQSGASHYTDPVWDTVRMNNIMDHFATAFFDYNLRSKTESRAYLELVPDAQDGVYAIEDGQETNKHTYWKGFNAGTAQGLSLEYMEAGE
jgi:predicted dienelactone hydrolase